MYQEEPALTRDEQAEWKTDEAPHRPQTERLQQQASTLLAASGAHALSGASQESTSSSQSSQENAQQPMDRSAGRPLARNGSPPSPSRAPAGPSVPASDCARRASVSESEAMPIPTVDVGGIHPELEGIPIKTSTLKKPTFTDSPSHRGTQASSTPVSPPTASPGKSKALRGSEKQMLTALAADDEADRLVMHAGHTPGSSHPTLPVDGSGAATASSHGRPTVLNKDSAEEAKHEAECCSSDACSRPDETLGDHPEPVFEPDEDRELTGPLMVRNMPAHDEIFFQKLSDKLEEVTKDHNAALPAVLKESEPAAAAAADGPVEQGSSQRQSQRGPRQGGPDADDPGTEESKSSSRQSDGEPEIPLKLKRSINLGAPFGEVR